MLFVHSCTGNDAGYSHPTGRRSAKHHTKSASRNPKKLRPEVCWPSREIYGLLRVVNIRNCAVGRSNFVVASRYYPPIARRILDCQAKTASVGILANDRLM